MKIYCVWLFEGLQPQEPSNIGYIEDPTTLSKPFNDILDSTMKLSRKAALLGKPRR